MYLNDWKEEGKDRMVADFGIDSKELEGTEVILATYTYEDYSGSAFVLFRKDGALYEVNGGHCSCYGLEGQWEPEPTDKAALLHRLNNGYMPFAELVRPIVEALA